MSGTLPALLVAVAFGIAVANAHPAARWIAMVAFVVAATSAAFAPIPVSWNERVHLACWVAIVACCTRIHVSNAIGVRTVIVLAVAAGSAGGAIASLANSRSTVISFALIAIATYVVAHVVAQRVPLAPKVVSSWLIAIALLAATLQILLVTPGYLPDHLE